MKRVLLVLLIAAFIAAGALYYLQRRAAGLPRTAPPDLVSLLPPRSSYILYADLNSLRASGLVQMLVPRLPAPSEDREYAEFVRATGFDYTRDLNRVAIAIEPGPQANSALAVAEGRFDRERIVAYVLRTGKRTRQNGADVYLVPSGNPPKILSFTFLAEKRIALADGMRLESVLAPAPDNAFDPSMQERIGRVAGSAFFAVARAGPLPQDAKFGGWVSEQFGAILSSIRWVTFAAQPAAVGEQMHVALEAECDTPENARQLAWTWEGVRLVGRAALADPKSRRNLDPMLAAALETILREGKVTRVDQTVRLSFMLTPQMLGATGGPSPPKTLQ